MEHHTSTIEMKDLIVADKIRIKVKVDEASRVWLYHCKQSRTSGRYKNLLPFAMKNAEIVIGRLGKDIDVVDDVLEEIKSRDTLMIQKLLITLQEKNLISL